MADSSYHNTYAPFVAKGAIACTQSPPAVWQPPRDLSLPLSRQVIFNYNTIGNYQKVDVVQALAIISLETISSSDVVYSMYYTWLVKELANNEGMAKMLLRGVNDERFRLLAQAASGQQRTMKELMGALQECPACEDIVRGIEWAVVAIPEDYVDSLRGTDKALPRHEAFLAEAIAPSATKIENGSPVLGWAPAELIRARWQGSGERNAKVWQKVRRIRQEQRDTLFMFTPLRRALVWAFLFLSLVGAVVWVWVSSLDSGNNSENVVKVLEILTYFWFGSATVYETLKQDEPYALLSLIKGRRYFSGLEEAIAYLGLSDCEFTEFLVTANAYLPWLSSEGISYSLVRATGRHEWWADSWAVVDKFVPKVILAKDAVMDVRDQSHGKLVAHERTRVLKFSDANISGESLEGATLHPLVLWDVH